MTVPLRHRAIVASVDGSAFALDAVRWAARADARWQEKYPDVEVRRVAVKDRQAHALLDAAREAQLLVVGSRGRGTLASIGLGSLATPCSDTLPVRSLSCDEDSSWKERYSHELRTGLRPYSDR